MPLRLQHDWQSTVGQPVKIRLNGYFGLLFQPFGWNALAAAVMVLASLTALAVFLIHPQATPEPK